MTAHVAATTSRRGRLGQIAKLRQTVRDVLQTIVTYRVDRRGDLGEESFQGQADSKRI